MEINSVQPEGAGSPIRSEGLTNDQFRVDAVPPGSALLIGDVTVFNVAGSFCATEAIESCVSNGTDHRVQGNSEA
jgi:hypothetical protein